MSKQNKVNKAVQKDVENSRAKKYILIMIIYTLIMVGIVVAAFFLPKEDNNSLPSRDDVSVNFSSTAFM